MNKTYDVSDNKAIQLKDIVLLVHNTRTMVINGAREGQDISKHGTNWLASISWFKDFDDSLNNIVTNTKFIINTGTVGYSLWQGKKYRSMFIDTQFASQLYSIDSNANQTHLQASNINPYPECRSDFIHTQNW